MTVTVTNLLVYRHHESNQLKTTSALLHCIANFIRLDLIPTEFRITESEFRRTVPFIAMGDRPSITGRNLSPLLAVKPSDMSFCSVFYVDYEYAKAEIEFGSHHTVFGLRKSKKVDFEVFHYFFSLYELFSSLILIYIRNNHNLMLILIFFLGS